MRFINFITKNESLLLGRWHYPKDKKILDRKIYLANYDHCGPCGKLVPKYIPKYLSITLEEFISEKNKSALHRLVINN